MLFFNSFPTAHRTHAHAGAIARRRRADTAVPPASPRDAESARPRAQLYSTRTTASGTERGRKNERKNDKERVR
eukprot:3791842-Pleurochrysis_carterae.AAC.1